MRFTASLLPASDLDDYVTRYVYDPATGRLDRTVFPDSAVESYGYAADGQLAWKRDRKGNKIGYVYDPHKRLERKQYNDEADGFIAFVYEGQKLVRVENRSQGVSEDHLYGYDEAYRTASEVQGPRGTVRWAYDVRDQVSRMSVDGGPTTDYTYYPDGSMNTIVWSLVPGEFKYRYTEAGQYETVTFPNGQTRNYTYDWAGRLTQLANLHPTAGNLATYSYEYDLDWATFQTTRKGQRTGMIADVPAQGFTGAYTKYYYDVHYQLTGADYPAAAPFNGEVARWTYDGIGNRTSETVNGIVTNYTYQRVSTNEKHWNRLVERGDELYVYDQAGNTISVSTDPLTSYEWNMENQMVVLRGQLNTTFRYDGQARRVGGGGETFLYDDFEVTRVDRSGDSVHFLKGFGVDELLAVYSGQAFFAATDGLGSVATLTDGSGAMVESSTLDVWGQSREQTSSQLDLSRFVYTGREAEYGPIQYSRFRYLDRSIGRFLSEDPLQEYLPLVGGAVYSYVGNNPVAFSDPFGLERCKMFVKFDHPKRETDWRNEWVKTSTHLWPQIQPVTSDLLSLLGLAGKSTVATTGLLMEHCVWTKYFIETQYLRQKWWLIEVCHCPDGRYQLGSGVDERILGTTRRQVRTAITKGGLGFGLTGCPKPAL